jgi:acyl-CoA synthetase (AMP-forming)/AMP-acid ligase II
MNTTDFLSISAAICPDRDAIVFEGKRITYSQINQRVNKLANALIRLGVKKGDRVAMLQVNCPECLETYFAVARVGAIYVPLNFRAKDDELCYMLEHSETRVLLAGKRYLDMIRAIQCRLPGVKHYISLEDKASDMTCFVDLINSAPDDEVTTDIGDEDVTILMYTAGTTGRPKGVPLRHSGFISYVMSNVDPANPDMEERNLLTVPLYHVAGIQAMLAAVYGGRTLVIMRQFEVIEWMKTVQQERATRAMLVPTMLKIVIDSADFPKYDLTSLKVITYGASPMPFEVITKAMKVLHWARFINAFGQTETASTITSLGPEDHIIEGTEEEKRKKLKRLGSSIGKPLPDVEVKILGKNGEVLPPGQIGDIVARGPRIMSGYWHDEEKTKKAFTPDGWLITSDQGWMDKDGYVYLAGRGDDMIIRAGENIAPEEIENTLHSHPKIEEAAVIGIPDPDWGQVPKAIVVLKQGQTATKEEIMEYCRAKLASFKRPRTVVFVNELPRNAMGKVIHKKLREDYGQP